MRWIDPITHTMITQKVIGAAWALLAVAGLGD
jgi:hypothetical protein